MCTSHTSARRQFRRAPYQVPEDLIGTVSFLTSGAVFITGQALNVDRVRS